MQHVESAVATNSNKMAARALKPDKLDIDTNDLDSAKKFVHWHRCMKSYINCLVGEDGKTKLD